MMQLSAAKEKRGSIYKITFTHVGLQWVSELPNFPSRHNSYKLFASFHKGAIQFAEKTT